MHRTRCCLALLALTLLAACGPRGRDVEASPVEALAARGGGQQFTCEGGHRIAVSGASAQVQLADGRRVALPPAGTGAWRGEALSFVVTSDRGSLTQDEVGTFLCMRAG